MSCYCSGVTDECGEATLFWSTLRMPVINNNPGFRLTDKRGGLDKTDNLQLRSSELSYSFTPRDRLIYYWQLPHQFLGNTCPRAHYRVIIIIPR